jgi:hypothetical protein
MTASLSTRARLAVLLAAIAALLFDGVELGLMPVASLSVSQELLGADYTPTLGGDWFARFTAALMLGAAVGGIALGNLGDVVGRTRALGISILFYSVFAGLGALVQTQEQMLVLRFLVGLGVGGVWPNAVALAFACGRITLKHRRQVRTIDVRAGQIQGLQLKRLANVEICDHVLLLDGMHKPAAARDMLNQAGSRQSAQRLTNYGTPYLMFLGKGLLTEMDRFSLQTGEHHFTNQSAIPVLGRRRPLDGEELSR